jgi:S-adenosylmethionine:tRNA ribosyltransferase-isomerase
VTPTIEFTVPAELEAKAPPENAGRSRDQVRLMVGYRSSGEIVDDRFPNLPDYLQPGDVLVINTSRTIPASVPGRTADDQEVVVHFSAPVAGDRWLVEVRVPSGFGTRPGPDLAPQRIDLPAGAALRLIDHPVGTNRLWNARIDTQPDVLHYLGRHGGPIRYGYAEGPWPLESYQTVYARQPGSVEMPSAGRPFTTDMLAAISARGVVVVPVVLHTGVASVETGEPPGEERCIVSRAAADVINSRKRNGGRVVAVGTTSTRAVESATNPDGIVFPFDGQTDLVICPDRPVRVVDALITGWHEPRASHLDLVEAVAGVELTGQMYARALAHGYLWHEFGDSCLILP